MLGLQNWNSNIFATPAYAVAGVLVFLILVNIFNSKAYYEVLNTVLPFRLTDPIGWLGSLLNRGDRSV